MITFSTKADRFNDAVEAMKKLDDKFTADTLWEEVGVSVRDLIAKHLTKKDTKPNKHGWPKTHFYARCSNRVSSNPRSGGVDVEIADERFNQRYYGGRIKPVKAKALTIPLIPEAYGRRAREFKLSFTRQWPDNLREPKFKRKGGKAGGIKLGYLGTKHDGAWEKIYFLLVSGVRQDPDPSVLPTDEQIEETVNKSINDVIDSV